MAQLPSAPDRLGLSHSIQEVGVRMEGRPAPGQGIREGQGPPNSCTELGGVGPPERTLMAQEQDAIPIPAELWQSRREMSAAEG